MTTPARGPRTTAPPGARDRPIAVPGRSGGSETHTNGNDNVERARCRRNPERSEASNEQPRCARTTQSRRRSREARRDAVVRCARGSGMTPPGGRPCPRSNSKRRHAMTPRTGCVAAADPEVLNGGDRRSSTHRSRHGRRQLPAVQIRRFRAQRTRTRNPPERHDPTHLPGVQLPPVRGHRPRTRNAPERHDPTQLPGVQIRPVQEPRTRTRQAPEPERETATARRPDTTGTQREFSTPGRTPARPRRAPRMAANPAVAEHWTSTRRGRLRSRSRRH